MLSTTAKTALNKWKWKFRLQAASRKMSLAWKGCRPNDHLVKGDLIRCVPSADFGSGHNLCWVCWRLPKFVVYFFLSMFVQQKREKKEREFQVKHLDGWSMILQIWLLFSLWGSKFLLSSAFFGGRYVAPQPPPLRDELCASLRDTTERGRWSNLASRILRCSMGIHGLQAKKHIYQLTKKSEKKIISHISILWINIIRWHPTSNHQ